MTDEGRQWVLATLAATCQDLTFPIMLQQRTRMEHFPDSILLHIFLFLDGPDLTSCCCVCQRWMAVASDDSLYRNLVRSVYKVDVKKGLALGKDDWRSEYKRLYYHVPTIFSETLTEHTDEVLHVTFSHNGQLFSTTSKDCSIKVWQVGYPTRLKYSYSFVEKFEWNFTQFSCFNCDDSKLLVSSVKSNTLDRRGYVAILSIGNEFKLLKIVNMDPSQLFGAWLDFETFLGGSLNINLENREALVSVNVEAFKAGSDVMDTEEDISLSEENGQVLFTFSNDTASLIKFLTVVRNTSLPNISSELYSCQNDEVNNMCQNICRGKCKCIPDKLTEVFLNSKEDNSDMGAAASFSNSSCDSKLVYVTGEFAVALHQVGVKFLPKDILSSSANKHVEEDIGHMVLRVSNQEIEIRPDRKPDVSDQMIDLNGHVTGLCLSKDHRYLYINCRPWEGEIDRSDNWNTPSLSQNIEIRVFDLWDLSDTGQRYMGHKGLSPSTMCCFVFLDTSDDYVGSGSENCKGYLWDKHYKSLLSTYDHGSGVVNAVAFNPVNQEYFVTVSDDKTIQIWRSKYLMSQIHKDELPKS